MLLGLVLLYVGAVLCLNGLWLLGRIDDREIAFINIAVGGLTLLVSLYLAFGPKNDLVSIQAGALTLLFSFTYLWVAYNRFHKVDGRGLGWFSLFVSITVIPIGLQTLANSGGDVWQVWFGLSWLAWAVLWFLFFQLLAMQRDIGKINRPSNRAYRGFNRLVAWIFTA